MGTRCCAAAACKGKQPPRARGGRRTQQEQAECKGNLLSTSAEHR